MVARENLLGVQFHPEKSGPFGLRIYDNFVRIATEARALSVGPRPLIADSR